MVKHKFTILFVGWMVSITLFSLFSFSSGGEDIIWFPHLDKIAHFTFHVVIMVLGAFSLNGIMPKKWRRGKKLKWLAAFSVSYGLLIELLQWLMPFDRSAEFWDIMANLSGTLVGGLLIHKNRSRIYRLK